MADDLATKPGHNRPYPQGADKGQKRRDASVGPETPGYTYPALRFMFLACFSHAGSLQCREQLMASRSAMTRQMGTIHELDRIPPAYTLSCIGGFPQACGAVRVAVFVGVGLR